MEGTMDVGVVGVDTASTNRGPRGSLKSFRLHKPECLAAFLGRERSAI